MSIIFLRVEIRGPFVALRKGSRARSRMLWVTEGECWDEGKLWVGLCEESGRGKLTCLAALEHKQPLQFVVPLTTPDFPSHSGENDVKMVSRHPGTCLCLQKCTQQDSVLLRKYTRLKMQFFLLASWELQAPKESKDVLIIQNPGWEEV